MKPADGDSLRLLREVLELDTHAERERLLGIRCKDRPGPSTAAALCSRAAVRGAQGRIAEARADLDATTALVHGDGERWRTAAEIACPLREELAER